MRTTITKYLSVLLIFLMALMTLDVLWGVFTRFVFSDQASWTEELARFLLIWIGILGAAYASTKKMHPAIELLKPKLNLNRQMGLSILVSSLIILFAVLVMVLGGGRLIYISYTLGQASPAMGIPMYFVYAVIPLSGLLIVYFKFADILSLNQPQA
ncbi:MAG: TRAP transporter small permease [Bacteroidia bacterium]|nr:TRAP transporter small permease [Bacteroidia bacterium]